MRCVWIEFQPDAPSSSAEISFPRWIHRRLIFLDRIRGEGKGYLGGESLLTLISVVSRFTGHWTKTPEHLDRTDTLWLNSDSTPFPGSIYLATWRLKQESSEKLKGSGGGSETTFSWISVILTSNVSLLWDGQTGQLFRLQFRKRLSWFFFSFLW